MRWPFGPPHLTLKPSKQKTPPPQKKKTNKKSKTKKEKVKKHKIPKKSFSVISHNFLFWGGVQKLPFLTTWPRERAPPKHYKIGVSAYFLKKVMRHERPFFDPKKPKSRNSSYHFFCLFSLPTTKTSKLAETPIL